MDALKKAKDAMEEKVDALQDDVRDMKEKQDEAVGEIRCVRSFWLKISLSSSRSSFFFHRSTTEVIKDDFRKEITEIHHVDDDIK